MTYGSVDELQRVLTDKVFHYAKDKKKAAGRALGTLVEVITFYLLRGWGIGQSVAIERPLPEYCNADITHNVEYSLHPSTIVADLHFGMDRLPISVAKIAKALSEKGILISADRRRKQHQLITSKRVLRNACTIADEAGSFLVATLSEASEGSVKVTVRRLLGQPFAIVECKRVGVEEGTRKGPQTIEKAKQGAYVARTVSSLQKIRLRNGEVGGCFVPSAGQPICKPYNLFIQEIVGGDDPEFLRRFILTVGVVSNHGNWFTSGNHNKEMKVLAQSYDWLLFLTDKGLSHFVEELILSPSATHEPVRDAFLTSYTGQGGKNEFTKVQMALGADLLLRRYFAENTTTVESWFNVISPAGQDLSLLRSELHGLANKDWGSIHI